MPEAAALHKVCSWDESPDRRYRYWLEALVETADGVRDNSICLFLMLNPNKADYDRSDPTADRCKCLARTWNYQTLWICNLFPVRAGDSNALPDERMGPHRPDSLDFAGCALCRSDSNDELHINDLHILAAAGKACIVVCAWGGRGKDDQRGRQVVKMLLGAGHEDKLYYFGLTQNERQPRHAKSQNPTQRPQPEDLKQWVEAKEWSGSQRSHG